MRATDDVTDDVTDARAALARGDALTAYDVATTVAADHPDNLEARFLVAVSLARAGARMRATRMIEELRAQLDPSRTSQLLWEDVEALAARLVKDRALAATGDTRAALARAAATRYETVSRRLRRHFATVNAASLWLIAGDNERATSLAQLALDYATPEPNEDAEASYWRLASRAEALLVLRDRAGAQEQLAEAAGVPGIGIALRARTRRQMAVVCAHVGADPSLLDVLDVPSVVHYSGHRATAEWTWTVPVERDLAPDVDHVLSHRQVGIGYGSAASGGDIVVAERLLARGAELHVVLPFGADEFEAVSVRPAGGDWSRRYRSVLERATTVTVACDSAFLDDTELFAYCSRIAMGHAINRSRMLGTEVSQLALWDGQPSYNTAGTAHDVAAWRRAGFPCDVVELPREPLAEDAPAAHRLRPAIRAVLFADLHGFSQLRDEHYADYLECVLAPLAAAVEPFRGGLVFHKTWGDGVQLVFADVRSAAGAALAMQEVCNALDLASLGLPSDLRLRIGAHAGRLLELPDPFDQTMSWWGREMTRAARIEPRTPEGEVYVTDAFAALLAIEPQPDAVCEYVGRVTTAKGFETIPMYRLTEADES
jgi:hypothetical protein